MPLQFDRAIGYAPTLEEFLEDLGISSPHDIRETVLGRCRELYDAAKDSGNLKTFEGSPYEFILCDSTDFYQTIVNLGFGNPALTIKDDFSPEVHFLLFRDKMPERFRPIIAAHESAEYEDVQSGTDQGIAHQRACGAELETAELLGLKEEYLQFVAESCPPKYVQLCDLCLSE